MWARSSTTSSCSAAVVTLGWARWLRSCRHAAARAIVEGSSGLVPVFALMSVFLPVAAAAYALRSMTTSRWVRPNEALAWNTPLDVHLDLADPAIPPFKPMKTCRLLDTGHQERKTPSKSDHQGIEVGPSGVR